MRHYYTLQYRQKKGEERANNSPEYLGPMAIFLPAAGIIAYPIAYIMASIMDKSLTPGKFFLTLGLVVVLGPPAAIVGGVATGLAILTLNAAAWIKHRRITHKNALRATRRMIIEFDMGDGEPSSKFEPF